MIGIVDSKICNIYSLTNMIKKLKAPFTILTGAQNFDNVDKIILPGVGAYPKAMDILTKTGLKDKIKDFAATNKPVLGICLGMQLLFDYSLEFLKVEGLSLIPGYVKKIETDMALPHIGWNDITSINVCQLLNDIPNNSDMYFVHTFRAETEKKYIAATTTYGEVIPAVVYKNNVFGAQFHPEKSMKWGEILLSNFINL